MRGRWFGAVACGLLTVVGVAILVVGGADGRALGAMVVLFFGVGGLALAAPLLSRSEGVELVEVGGEPGFFLPVSRAKQSVFVVAAFGLTVASVLIVMTGALVVGIPATVIFAGLLGVLAKGLMGRHGVAVTPTRVVVDVNGHAEVRWEDVAEIALRQQLRSHYLGIRARSPHKVTRATSGRFSRLNRRLTSADVLIPADSLAASPEEALHVLEHYLERPKARRQIGTADELARVL